MTILNKKNKKTLGIFIITFLLFGSSSVSEAANERVTTQLEADERLNAPLQRGDLTYDMNITGSILNSRQIQPAEDIEIHGNTNRNSTLTLNGTIESNDRVLRPANVYADSKDVTFENLKSLNVNLQGNPDTVWHWCANFIAFNGGTITVRDGVKELNLGNTVHPSNTINSYSRSNILTGDNGTIKIYSPKVTITNSSSGEGGGSIPLVAAGCSLLGSANANIYLGDENHVLDSVMIQNTNSSDDERYGLSAEALGAEDAARIYVFSKNLSVENMYKGISSFGRERGNTEPGKGALVQIGSMGHPAGNINLDHNGLAIHGMYHGKINIYGDQVNISHAGWGSFIQKGSELSISAQDLTMNNTIQTAVHADQGGKITIHTVHKADISGIYGTVVNHDGYVSINNDEEDGATVLTGIVGSSGNDARTDLGFHTNDSYFNGNAFDGYTRPGSKTTITVSNGARWRLNRMYYDSYGGKDFHSYIDTLNLSHGGAIDLGGTVTGYIVHTAMRTAHLEGTGGTLVFHTNLQESANTHTVNGHSDQFFITDSSSGVHNIMIYDASYPRGSIPAVTGGYVLLVHDESAAPRAVFTGNENLQNGGLFAHPIEITNRPPAPESGYTDVPTDGLNWYVHMVTDPSVPLPETINAENNTTFSRSRYGALWVEQETLRQRLGELRDHKQDDGIWARITRGEYTMNGVSGNADYTMYHIGYDKKVGNQSGHKQYIGMAYHHTDTDLNYRHFTDDSDMDADIGTIYYTNLGDKGHYLDIVGKFGRMKGKMKTFGEFPESAKWDSPFYSLSAEYGRKINYGNGWYWEPQAQLTYSHLGSDNYLTSQGTHAHLDDINSLIFRTGFTVGKKNGRNEYYGKVFWHHEFEGAEDTYFHDKNDDRLHDSYDFGSSWVTVGLGGQVGLSKDAYLYGDVEKSFGGDVKKKWAWNIGVRIGF